MMSASTIAPATDKIMAELATDWASPTGMAIQKILYEENLKHSIEG